MFADLERSLLSRGARDFHFTLIGEGSEREWLRKNLAHREAPGILRGEALADAFANLDAFVFPSRTDTFGLVLLEAMASGVAVVASPEIGARVGIEHGVTGFHAADLAGFTESVMQLMHSQTLRQRMGAQARAYACRSAWSEVFDQLYQTYQRGLEASGMHAIERAAAESRTTS